LRTKYKKIAADQYVETISSEEGNKATRQRAKKKKAQRRPNTAEFTLSDCKNTKKKLPTFIGASFGA
jgi:hypothetical protein